MIDNVFPTGQTSSSVRLSNISPIDVVNDGIVCPNVYPVEFTCIGVEVGILQWDRNDQRIDVFTSLSEKGSVLQDGPLTLFLDSIIRSGSGYNMTSRLVTNISNLNTGDRILCRTMNAMDAIELNYMLRGNQDFYSMTWHYYLFNHFPHRISTCSAYKFFSIRREQWCNCGYLHHLAISFQFTSRCDVLQSCSQWRISCLLSIIL